MVLNRFVQHKSVYILDRGGIMTGGSSCCTLWLSLAILGNTLLPTLSFIAPASVGVSLRNGAAIADVAPFKSIAREPWVPGGATARRARQLGGLKSSVNADGSGPVTLLRVEFAESNAEVRQELIACP